VALGDALAATELPFIAVELVNRCAVDPVPSRSRLSEVALGTIAGLGSRGYDFALAFALAQLHG
jgi:3-dehydroquinate dehydratase-2